MPLFSLFLFEKFLLFKPPGPNKHLASHTAQPGSLPRILQQTLLPGWGFSCPGPGAGPRDLIVLKHSSYHLIFQCPLQFLVSDIHICCSTGGCSLCSSDQLGVSLVQGEVDSAPTYLAAIFLSPPNYPFYIILLVIS